MRKGVGEYSRIFSVRNFQMSDLHGSILNKETGYRLELDGYCPKLKLAFEYDGIQHYKYPNPFHRDLRDFNRQRKRDGIKNRRCKSHKVILIRIKYDIPDLEKYIKGELKEKGFISE